MQEISGEDPYGMAKNTGSREKRKVIFLTDNYHSLGGVQRSTTTIANSLYTRGHEVKIISISPGAIPMAHALDPNIKVVTCNPKVPTRQKLAHSSIGSKIYGPITRIFDYWKPRKLQFAAPLKQGVQKLFQGIESHDQKSIIVVTNVAAMHYLNQALLKRTTPRPRIIGQYKGDFSIMSRSNVKRLVTTYATADLLLALTREDAAQLLRVAKTPVNYISNPIQSAPLVYREVPKEKCFVALGRLSEEKSYASAIHAWKPIARKFPDWKLLIFGQGPLRSELEELIWKEGLADSIDLPGKTDDPLSVFASARANIVTSKHEGFGLTISEAATVGTPTIAYDSSPGIRLQVRHEENGLLVPPGDVGQLSEAIERIISDQQFYDGLRYQALAYVGRFGVEETIRKWEDFFDEISV